MNKVIWILVVLFIGGYIVNSSIENNAKRDLKRAESKKIKLATKTAVLQMVSRTNSIDNWQHKLTKGEKYRFEPILTIELEKHWIQQQPILFIGAIKDITTLSNAEYVVLVERSLTGSFDYMFDTGLQLSLSANKEMIDSFLKDYPNLFKDYGFNNGIAVIAHINSIRTIHVAGEDGVREDIKIGVGELIDIMYTGGVNF